MNEEWRFDNRMEAGKALAAKLMPFKDEAPLILALPRGGVPIGYEVARALDAPLDTIVVRKIGAPLNPEYGIGAIALPDVVILDEAAVGSVSLKEGDIDYIIQIQRQELARRADLYRSGSYAAEALGKEKSGTIIIVDDGLATGVTGRAAVESVRATYRPKKIIFSSPICARDAASAMRELVDEVVCVNEINDLVAIGYWYHEFLQTMDGEVVSLLEHAHTAWSKSAHRS